MEIESADIAPGVTMRLLARADAGALCAAYVDNRDHLRPWEPRRPESFFTEAGQRERIDGQLRLFSEGGLVPFVFQAADERIVGTITLNGIIRGALSSSPVGYWVAAGQQSRGLATAAVRRVCRIAREVVGLHRIEASTLLGNTGSQRVLAKCGFEPIGLAPKYLHIDGAWRDCRLFQRILHDDDPAL